MWFSVPPLPPGVRQVGAVWIPGLSGEHLSVGLSIAEIQVGSTAVVKRLPYNSLGDETGEGVGYLDIFWIHC